MKIAFVLKNFPALSETFILNQIIELIDRGHEVEIFAKRAKNTENIHPRIQEYELLQRTHYYPEIPEQKPARIASGIGVFVDNFPDRLGPLLQSLNVFDHGLRALSLQLIHEVAWIAKSDTDFDVIHCHFGPMGVLGLLLRGVGVLSAPLVTSFHGYDVHQLPQSGWLEPYQELFREAELLTANTSYTKQKLAEIGADTERIAVLPECLDVNSFTPERSKDPNPDPVRLLTVARLVEKKGLEYSIRAVDQLEGSSKSLQYDIIGEGERRRKLERLIEDLDLGDTVRLHGEKTQDDVLEYYRRADVFLLTSVTARNGDMEGQGLVIQEAQAMKLPVVTTKHNGIPEGVRPGESAFVVPERDSGAIAQKLKTLIEQPDLRRRMGEAGRTYVEENYNIATVTDKQIRLYEDLTQTTV